MQGQYACRRTILVTAMLDTYNRRPLMVHILSSTECCFHLTISQQSQCSNNINHYQPGAGASLQLDVYTVLQFVFQPNNAMNYNLSQCLLTCVRVPGHQKTAWATCIAVTTHRKTALPEQHAAAKFSNQWCITCTLHNPNIPVYCYYLTSINVRR